MVVNVFTADMFKSNLKLVAPVIDYNNFPKFITEIRVCPTCGKRFKVKLEIKNASPNNGKYCSADCRWRANQKTLSALVSEQEYRDFLELHHERVRKACNMAPLLAYRDPNAKWEDCYQECCIALFLLMARCKRQGRNYYSISEGSVFFQLKQAIKMKEQYCEGISCVRELLMDLGFDTKIK